MCNVSPARVPRSDTDQAGRHDPSARADDTLWLRIAALRGAQAAHWRSLREAVVDADTLATLLQGKGPQLRPHDTDSLEPVLEALRGRGSDAAVDSALDWQAADPDHHLIGFDSPAYPAALRSIDQPPPILYAHGDPRLLTGPNVAIVGSRKASYSALSQAETLAGELAAAGLGIVSGLALGIDGAAHRGALAAAGKTLAVLATPVDRCYPARHRSLSLQLARHGVLVSESALGTTLHAGCFPRRNRLISGLSLGVVVVEAALPSGSLITARHALDQGIEVMAIPGSVRNHQARGCHDLIRQGATLVESATDVLAVLTPALAAFIAPGQAESLSLSDEIDPVTRDSTALLTEIDTRGLTNEPHGRTVLACLDFDPVSVDTLIDRCGLSVVQVSSALSLLEMQGLVHRHAGGRYSLTVAAR